MDLLSSLIIGVSLAAACGLRVFVPLLVVSVAAHAGQLTLAPELAWIGTTPALLAFGIATACEIGGYYLPWVDNMLDSLATPAAAVAGTIIAAAVVTDIDPFLKWALAIVAGGGTAGAVQSVTVLARGVSSLTTGGFANPLLSTAESGGSIVTAGVAMIFPWLAFLLVVLFFAAGAILLFRRRRPYPRSEPPPEV